MPNLYRKAMQMDWLSIFQWIYQGNGYFKAMNMQAISIAYLKGYPLRNLTMGRWQACARVKLRTVL